LIRWVTKIRANIKTKKEGFKQMAIQKKGLLIGGIIAVIIAAGGICAAVLPDALHKEESSISNRTVTTTAAPASTDTENSDQAPETYQSVLSEYYTALTSESDRMESGSAVQNCRWLVGLTIPQ
jgi:hypothetical protein